MSPQLPSNPSRGRLQIGPVVVDLGRMCVLGRGDAGRLTPKTLAVLMLLCQHAGDVVRRNELIDRVWAGSDPSDDAVSYAVRQLRRALGDNARSPRLIQTVHGVGYRLVVQPCFTEPAEAMKPPPAPGDDLHGWTARTDSDAFAAVATDPDEPAARSEAAAAMPSTRVPAGRRVAAVAVLVLAALSVATITALGPGIPTLRLDTALPSATGIISCPILPHSRAP